MSANATPFASGGIYSADAVEVNRAGRLTDIQRRQFGAIDTAWRWHVDNDGHLHADAMSHDEAGEAWVVGDTLGVASGGTGVSFTRTN